MENLLTFNLRVPVGVQVVSQLISENTIIEQLLLMLSPTVGGCKYAKYRKEIESFTNGHLSGLDRL
jgi:predicted nucleotide-binding protein (sugar kinase/HSP70/actin superfamily)